MKISQFIIFLSVVLLIHVFVNLYIYFRCLHALPASQTIRNWYTAVFIFLFLSYIIARILEKLYPSVASDIFTWIGSFWLGIMAYLFLIYLIADVVLLINKVIPILKTTGISIIQYRVYSAYFAIILTVILVIIGHINAKLPRITEKDIYIGKNSIIKENIKMIVVTDVHLGTLIGKRNTARMVKLINSIKPDLVVFGGDLIDEDVQSVIRRDIGEKLLQIKTKYGVFAVSGNHEYIGGITRSLPYLENHGIKVLRDTAIKIGNGFYLIGREDKDKYRFTGIPRKHLSEIMTGIDSTYPLILFDHQPSKLNEAISQKIDLQISGHTHHGQIFPFNLITNAIYEISSGYKKIGETQFYVSNGFGTWGPPVRLGNRPEIIVFNLKFNQEQ